MALKCGIIGLPNVGKSTLFNCLSSAKAIAANFPFCTIEPNVGITMVPDARLDKLCELVKPKNVQAATVEIVDIAGLVKGASKGEGLGNQFLANIRECDAVLHVLRCFDDDNVIHVDGKVNPIADKEIIDTELQLKDLDSVQKQIPKLERAAKAGDKKAIQQLDILNQYKQVLEQGKSARTVVVPEDQREFSDLLFLLTNKPVLYVCNVDEKSVIKGNVYVEKVREMAKQEGAEICMISAKIESDIAELEDPQDRKDFLSEIGLTESGVNRLVQAAYQLLKLQTYFTAGVQEVRAWTIKKGDKAPQAAGVIHSDFEKGFIRAEIIAYTDFVQYGSEAGTKAAGKMRVEGKEYVVADGDVIHFLFNV